MIVQVLRTVLPVFIALGIGVICRKAAILSRAGVDALKKVAVDITLPAVLLSAFASAEYSPTRMVIPLMLFLVCGAALILGYAAKRFFKNGGRLIPYLMTGFEGGMLGYGLFALLYPNEPTSSFALIDLGQVFFVFTVYKVTLAGRENIRAVAKEALVSPVLIAILTGLLLGVTGLYAAIESTGIPAIINEAAGFIGAPTSCLILITIGYDLRLDSVPWKKVFSLTGLRIAVMGVMLVIGYLVNNYLLGGAMHIGAFILMLMLPPPYVLPIFADREDERTETASALSFMTLVTLALFAVMAAVVAVK